jgi:hypothetical protein
MALLLSAFAPVALASSVSTETTLKVTTVDSKAGTKATLQVSVAGVDGTAASGAVSIKDGDKTLAGVALDDNGQATTKISLPSGSHALRAVYNGNSTYIASASPQLSALGATSSTPGFTLSLTPVTPSSFPMTLTAGNAGTVKVTVTPTNNSALTTPMFVTLSCSNLPDQASCTFSPATVEILSTTATSCTSGATNCPPTSTMILQTQAGSTAKNAVSGNPIAWALLLPGVLGFGGMAWAVRRRRWMSRLSLLALLVFAVTIGTTGCNPRYSYYNHGPDPNLPPPAGTYTVKVTGQSSDSITSVSDSTTMVLTVQ